MEVFKVVKLMHKAGAEPPIFTPCHKSQGCLRKQ